MKCFMKNTPWEGWERLMMTTPNHIPRGGGSTILNRFRYKSEDVDCQYCTEYHHRKCMSPKCFWLEERMEAGAVNYPMLVAECFRTLKDYVLVSRIQDVVSDRDSIQWTGFLHEQRLSFWRTYLTQKAMRIIDYDQLAILYLLTAWDGLWRLSQPHLIDMVSTSDPDFVSCKAGLPEDMLLKAIRSICGKKAGITLAELKDKELVSDETLRLIINAALICRYGQAIFLMKDDTDQND